MFRIAISILLYIVFFFCHYCIFSWYFAEKFLYALQCFFMFQRTSLCNNVKIYSEIWILSIYLNLFRFDISISLSLWNLWLWSISRIHLCIHFHWAAALSHLSFIGIRYVFIWYFRKFSLSSYSQYSQITITCLVSSLKDDKVSN